MPKLNVLKRYHLYSSLRFFKYIFFNFKAFYIQCFILDIIKFHHANIEWDLCQNTAKFQNMTSLVDKICTNRQTSTGLYLLNWVLASMYGWVESHGYYSLYLHAGQLCTKPYMNSSDFAVYCHKFSCLCVWQVWYYLILSKLNPSFSFHKEHLVLPRIIR